MLKPISLCSELSLVWMQMSGRNSSPDQLYPSFSDCFVVWLPSIPPHRYQILVIINLYWNRLIPNSGRLITQDSSHAWRNSYMMNHQNIWPTLQTEHQQFFCEHTCLHNMTGCLLIFCPGADRHRFNNQLAQAGTGIQWRRYRHSGRKPPGGPEGAQWCQPENWSSPQGDQSREEANGYGHEAESPGNTGHDGTVFNFYLTFFSLVCLNTVYSYLCHCCLVSPCH